MDQDRLATREFGAVVESEPGKVKKKIECGRVGEGDPFRHLESRHDREDRVLRETAVRSLRHRHPAYTVPGFGAVSRRDDLSHDFHARAEGQFRAHHHVTPGDAFEIVRVEWTCPDPDKEFSGFGFRDIDLVEFHDFEGSP
jgi:hypothetical protein